MSYTSPHLNKHIHVEVLDALVQRLKEKLADQIFAVELVADEVIVRARRTDIQEVLTFLRDDGYCQFKQLVDLCGVDWLGQAGHEAGRFEVVYQLLSLVKNLRVRVKVAVPEGESVPTATAVFASAGWYERECYDLLGIRFDGHVDLRRILTDYGFNGHPLRKDFPLMGQVEVYYDKSLERVAYKAVDMPQALREFNKVSPWADMTGNARLAEEDSVFDEEEFKNADV